jgi:hypothetical protein
MLIRRRRPVNNRIESRHPVRDGVGTRPGHGPRVSWQSPSSPEKKKKKQ